MSTKYDVDLDEGEKILVVFYNLNNHSPAAFYVTFPPQQASGILYYFGFMEI